MGTEDFYCGQDGFNYNGLIGGAGSINFPDTRAKAYCTGHTGDADGSYNGSTSHKDCRSVRVGCTYKDNLNSTIHDIEGRRSGTSASTSRPIASRTTGRPGMAPTPPAC